MKVWRVTRGHEYKEELFHIGLFLNKDKAMKAAESYKTPYVEHDCVISESYFKFAEKSSYYVCGILEEIIDL